MNSGSEVFRFRMTSCVRLCYPITTSIPMTAYRMRPLSGVHRLVLTHVRAIGALERAEHESGQHREDPEYQECPVGAVNQILGAGTKTIRYEQRGSESRGGDAKADGELLKGTDDGAGAAGLSLIDVGEHQRVHAGVLKR